MKTTCLSKEIGTYYDPMQGFVYGIHTKPQPLILFFMRRFNDIDHITPIVYRFVKDGHRNVAVLLMIFKNQKLDLKDFRLEFLRKHGVEIKWVYDYYKPTLKHKLAARLIHYLPYQYQMKLQKIFDMKWAMEMLRDNEVKAIVYDIQTMHKTIIGTIAEVAGWMGIGRCAVPHGIVMFANDDIYDEHKR